MIYFIQPTHGGPVKIGFSTDVDRRRDQLESHYGKPLALLATMPGGAEEEAEIHARFAHLRFGRTEQFRPAPELLAFIGRPLLVSADPDAVEAMEPAKSNVMSIRGKPEWRDWLMKFAQHCRTDAVGAIDRALAEMAMREGFADPPPRT